MTIFVQTREVSYDLLVILLSTACAGGTSRQYLYELGTE